MKFYAEPLLAVYEQQKRKIFGDSPYMKKIFLCQFNENGEFETEDADLIAKLAPKFKHDELPPEHTDPFLRGYYKAAAEIAARKAQEPEADTSSVSDTGTLEESALHLSPQGEGSGTPGADAESLPQSGDFTEVSLTAPSSEGAQEDNKKPADEDDKPPKVYKCKECDFETDNPGKIAAHYKSKHPKPKEDT